MLIYTGGTTGMPKGVMFAMGGLTGGLVSGGFPLLGLTPPSDISTVVSIVGCAVRAGNRVISIPCAPLVRGTGRWLGAFIPHSAGGTVITRQRRSFNADEILGLVRDEHATSSRLSATPSRSRSLRPSTVRRHGACRTTCHR